MGAGVEQKPTWGPTAGQRPGGLRQPSRFPAGATAQRNAGDIPVPGLRCLSGCASKTPGGPGVSRAEGQGGCLGVGDVWGLAVAAVPAGAQLSPEEHTLQNGPSAL